MRLRICISCSRTLEYVGHTSALFCSDCSVQHDREKSRAIHKVAYAVKRGALPRASDCECVDCGKPARNYDHRDYTRPLDVVPVCVRCNNVRGPALDSQMRAVLLPGREVEAA